MEMGKKKAPEGFLPEPFCLLPLFSKVLTVELLISLL